MAITPPTGNASARALSAAHERQRATLAASSDAAVAQRFALPDPSSPDYEASLRSLEQELDRSIAQLDQQNEREAKAKAEAQLSDSADDPATLSDYKRAEAIKHGAG